MASTQPNTDNALSLDGEGSSIDTSIEASTPVGKHAGMTTSAAATTVNTLTNQLPGFEAVLKDFVVLIRPADPT